jgi:anti-sigma factor ChrR (cupin superfamily)
MSLKLANLIGIPVVGLHQGQRTYAPRHQAGHMTAADQTVQHEKSACHEAVHICLIGADAGQGARSMITHRFLAKLFPF